MLRVVIDVLDRALAWLAGVTLLTMMLLTFADVVGRYLFGRPVAGAFEATELLLAITVFAAMPSVTQRDSHIKLDFLDFLMPEELRRFIDWLSSIVMIGILLLLGYAVWMQASKMRAAGLYTDILGFPTHLVVFFVSILLVVSGVFLIGRVAFGIIGTSKGGGSL